MPSCLLNFQVRQADGVSPASLAYVRKFRVYNFLWWRFRWFESSSRTDFYGRTVFYVEWGARYYIDGTWVGTDARVRSNSIEFVVVSCPASQHLEMPR